MRREELINALKIIKNECATQPLCNNCPFKGENCCKIKELDPEQWNINENIDIWRAFK